MLAGAATARWLTNTSPAHPGSHIQRTPRMGETDPAAPGRRHPRFAAPRRSRATTMKCSLHINQKSQTHLPVQRVREGPEVRPRTIDPVRCITFNSQFTPVGTSSTAPHIPHSPVSERWGQSARDWAQPSKLRASCWRAAAGQEQRGPSVDHALTPKARSTSMFTTVKRAISNTVECPGHQQIRRSASGAWMCSRAEPE
jgi:hypothetical protein